MRKSIRNKIVDKVVAIAATAAMVFSSFNIMGFAETDEANTELKYKNNVVQAQLEKWLGDVKNYGVVAETATINIDFESNVATNMLYTNGATIGASVANGYVNEGGDIYVRDFEGPLKIARRGATEFVVYTGLTMEAGRTNQRVFFEEKDNNVTYINTDDYAYIPVWNCITLDGEEILDITANRQSLNNVFTSYKSVAKETDGVVKAVNGNKYVVDVTAADEQICFVNVNLSDITAYGPDTLAIYKEENQMIVFNINIDVEGDVNLSRFTVNGQTSVRDDASITDQLIWNLAGYDGNIYIGEMAGVVVAPLADITIVATSRGRVICDEFNMTGGEMHFISKFVKVEEEPDEPETETSTSVPETETTSIPETTITEVETTTTESETTTTEPETTTTEPESTTTESETTTTESESTTTESETTTTESESTTTEPESTTTEPETTTTESESTTTEPESTTTEPESTTTEPETTSDEEETITTSIPYGEETTTPEDETTTTAPEETTSQEEETTTLDETETTTPPGETTSDSGIIEEESTEEETTTVEVTTTVEETTSEEEEELITTSIPFGGLDPETTPDPEEEITTPEETTTDEEEIEFIIPFAGTSPKTGDNSNVAFYMVLLLGSITVLIGYKFGVRVKVD